MSVDADVPPRQLAALREHGAHVEVAAHPDRPAKDR